jgi:membrane-associated phospholipid phosphatase
MSWLDGGYTAHERTDHRAPFGAVSAPSIAGRRPRPVGDGVVGVTKRTRTRWIIPVGVTACYVLFALGVHLRMLDAVDLAVRGVYGPVEVWGPLETRADLVVKGLQPAHLALPLLLVVTVLSLLRRSLRPVAVMGVVGGLAIFVTLGSKWAMAHSEGSPMPVAHGSFPSGHTVSVIVAFGLAVLLLRPGTHWGWLLPALMGSLMGWAIVVAAVHPATDVLGAGLLGLAVLGSARAAGLGQWASKDLRRGPHDEHGGV